jgi:hypothetical protein
VKAAFVIVLSLVMASAAGAQQGPRADQLFFEAKIRPVLESRCVKCHAGVKAKGGLALDHRDGLRTGGDSGPALVPGKPGESLLLRALRHEGVKMPPDARLSDAVIADFRTWIERGAIDPRDEPTAGRAKVKADWESIYQKRLDWWSLRPLRVGGAPVVREERWIRNDVDRFILQRLESKGLQPVPEASVRMLARRLSFALTGLPPEPTAVARWIADDSPQAAANFVESLLKSPHFGEHWARHWMDVVHYADTHGYEWDVPARDAWRYRDYLIRAFNADVPLDRLIREHIAGDLIEPRLDPDTGLNESLIGPMSLRLGERRHGDNSQVEGVTHEAIANLIDTISKGFLGTTVACARCHDHKLDAIAQKDYYALAGVFMSSRFTARSLEDRPNRDVLTELGTIKEAMRLEMAQRWLADRKGLRERVRATKVETSTSAFPESLPSLLEWLRAGKLAADAFAKERQRRIDANRTNVTVLADFTTPDGANGWRWDGIGMKHGLAKEGAFVVAGEGNKAVQQILPAGRWSHLWSPRLAGALRSPLFEGAFEFSVGISAGGQTAQTFVIDQCLNSERMSFLDRPSVGWLTLRTGNFTSLEGSVDRMKRRIYFELATKSLNNYYPPRTGYGGVKESDLTDPRSWFGVTRVVRHPPGNGPMDELARFEPVFRFPGEADARLTQLVIEAIERWASDASLPDDARLLDEALRLGWLANDLPEGSRLKQLVARYREAEAKLQPDRTVGSIDDWNEAQDERIGIRGSYNELGEAVPRGGIRFLGGPTLPTTSKSSGRLQLAEAIASPKNPLTARVYVNRVWLHLFGEGLVRTPDDFGHLGEPPVHGELLDYLASRFIADGWSTKKLIRLLVQSATWRQASIPTSLAKNVDPENRLWHHMPMRRLQAESIRDAILATSGRLDKKLYGPPIEPYRTAEDRAKRLLKGPLDGEGRRSIYLRMTLMEPPRFLVLFNQPFPNLTVGKRDVANTPDQALAMLNDPFVIAMARHWGDRMASDESPTFERKLAIMFEDAFSRPPTQEDTARLHALWDKLILIRNLPQAQAFRDATVWQEMAHALLNAKEFIYVP